MPAMAGVCVVSAVVVGVRVVAARTAAGFVMVGVVVLVVVVGSRWRAGGGATRLGRWGWWWWSVIGSPRQWVVRDVGWKVRSRRLLLTTKTLEKAMAAPAIIGLSRPSAASGMAATL